MLWLFLPLLACSGPANSVAPSDQARVCRAAIGSVMGRDPAIIRASVDSDGLVRVEYIRPDDRKLFAYKCRLEGTRVVWGNADGRWRNDSQDSVITFALLGSAVSIIEKWPDGSSTENTFDIPP